jgi:putative PIN family toxin of toxin-antitoxin system
MTVVIDTNALLPMLAPANVNRAILRAWSSGCFVWAISTAILLEYEEITMPRVGARRWQEFLRVMDFAGQLYGNVLHVEPSFHWRLITADPDDDKFADCAIAAEAEWIITEDGHFSTLAASGHKPRAITPAEFIARFLTP